MLILIAGPYRSGTNNDLKLIKKNMDRLEAVSLPIFRKGHIPMIGIPNAKHHLMLDEPIAFVTALRSVLALWQ